MKPNKFWIRLRMKNALSNMHYRMIGGTSSQDAFNSKDNSKEKVRVST